jgi:hypothetical protein
VSCPPPLIEPLNVVLPIFPEVSVPLPSVTVLPAEEEPSETLDGDPHGADDGETDLNTASDWLPGIRDEHDDEGRGAAWRDRPTWDRSVTPNVRRRTGSRPARRR